MTVRYLNLTHATDNNSISYFIRPALHLHSITFLFFGTTDTRALNLSSSDLKINFSRNLGGFSPNFYPNVERTAADEGQNQSMALLNVLESLYDGQVTLRYVSYLHLVILSRC
jgi:hypothetical protein